MGFSHIKTGSAAAGKTSTKTETKAAETAKAPETEAKQVEATVVETEAKTTVAVREDTASTAMSLFDGGGMGKSVLAVITAADGPRELAFPILSLQGGNGGGSFSPIKAVPEEVANQMPQGKKPFTAFILGFRTELVAWPVGFEDKEDDTKPVWSVTATSADARATELIRKACKQYQFTGNKDKAKFDFAQSEVGHIRPVLQLLVWLPDVEDLIVVQTPSHYMSWLKTGEQLNRNADPKTGEVRPFPAQLRPVSTSKTVNGYTITEHVIDITAMLNDAGAQVFAAYSKWRETAKSNPELVERVGKWVQGLDAPMTDEIEKRLRTAASL